MSLYTKTIIKNALQDKGRMATTIIGVVGSISLLVICLVDEALHRERCGHAI